MLVLDFDVVMIMFFLLGSRGGYFLIFLMDCCSINQAWELWLLLILLFWFLWWEEVRNLRIDKLVSSSSFEPTTLGNRFHHTKYIWTFRITTASLQNLARIQSYRGKGFFIPKKKKKSKKEANPYPVSNKHRPRGALGILRCGFMKFAWATTTAPHHLEES